MAALAAGTVVLVRDPLEIELRYVLDGREIISRRQVSAETFFRTRGMKTLKVKVAPKRPELWTVA